MSACRACCCSRATAGCACARSTCATRATPRDRAIRWWATGRTQSDDPDAIFGAGPAPHLCADLGRALGEDLVGRDLAQRVGERAGVEAVAPQRRQSDAELRDALRP